MTCVHTQLRDDLGGVEFTPTVLVVLFHEDTKKIAKIEGVDKVRGAIRSGAAEAIIRGFMEERVKLRMADRLAEQLALRLAFGMAVTGAGAAAARKRREDELKERFEKEMEKEVEKAKEERAPKRRDDDDDDDKGEVSARCPVDLPSFFSQSV